MGTRSVHAIKLAKDKGYHCQYLQFDGYPRHQLPTILEKVIPFIERLKLDSSIKREVKDFRDYLLAFYNFRQYETGHSHGNHWIDKKIDVADLSNRCWAEYVYVFNPENFSLEIIRPGGSLFRLELKSEELWKDIGFQKYGQWDKQVLEIFCKQVENKLK